MSLARSFIKGPRFAFTPKTVTACERCVWGTGKHTCRVRPTKEFLDKLFPPAKRKTKRRV